MKKEKRIGKQLTSRKATTISAVTAILSGMIFFWLPYYSGEGVFLSVIISLIFAIVAYIWFYFCVLKGTDREIEERKKAWEVNYKKIFSTEELTEIIFVPGRRECEAQINLENLKNAGCRFFAKIDEDENIIFVICNKDNERIYEDKMENYFHAKCKIEY